MGRGRTGIGALLPPAIAVACLLAPVPAEASRPARIDPPAAGGEPGREQGLTAAVARLQQGDCAGALAILDPLVADMTGRQRNAVQILRISCLGPVGRGDEIPGIYKEMAASEPDNPSVRAVGVFVAAQLDDMPEAARRLTALAEQAPDGLGSINGVLARGILQDLGERHDLAGRKRLFVALARADWQPADEPDMRESVAQGAIEALLADRRLPEAEAFLPRIAMPEILVTMATERLYEPLWPAIEARLGDHSGLAIDRFALGRLEAFTRSENDDRTRRDAIRAFILLGRYPEAIELGEKVAVVDGMSDDAVASVRYHAQALAAEGDRAGAIERLRPFTTIDPAKTPSSVSGLVGLAELLDEAARPAEALAVARAAQASSGDTISKWGRAWLRRTEVCALSTMGREGEAKPIADGLIAGSADNEAAAIEALLCAGRADDAAKIAVATLATPDGTAAIADQFQPEEAIWAPAGSRLRGLWVAFLTRTDVKAAFDRSARILPRRLWPARTPRPIPRRGTDEPSTLT